MEPDIAAELIVNNNDLKNENPILDTLIGDEDSSTYAAVRRKADHQVEKWSDLNHTTKKLSQAMWVAKHNRKIIDYIKCSLHVQLQKTRVTLKLLKLQ